MEQLFEFIANHGLLVAALVGLLLLFFLNEQQMAGQNLSPHQVTLLINKDNALILDVRERTEYQKGHLVNALNIPNSQLKDRLGELEKYKDQPIVLVCKMGQHSGAAGKLLKANGFAKVSRLKGGVGEWTGANLPLVKS